MVCTPLGSPGRDTPVEIKLIMLAKTTAFCKNEDCPPSNDLLQFQIVDLSRLRSRAVRKHLTSCEFCAAEVEFYSHYPQEEGSSEPTAIPAPLFQLAEALLKNRGADSRSLNALLRENEELIADTAN